MFTFEYYKVIITTLTRNRESLAMSGTAFFQRDGCLYKARTFLTLVLRISPKNVHPKISAHEPIDVIAQKQQ